jgi:sulfide:quinone oxidoreductase
MAQIVVIGAGLGGLPAAYELRHYLGKAHQVTLISEFPQFTFVPGLVQVGLGHIPLDHMQLNVPMLAKRHGFKWVQGKVQKIDPLQKRIYTHETLNYDYLIIASGAELANDLVPGLGIYTHSICTPSHVLEARTAWETFCQQPGDLVVGAAPGTGCFGPAYEYVLLAEADLRRRGIRDQVKITYITPEPYIGHLGIANMAHSQTLTEALMNKRGIATLTNAQIVNISSDHIFLADGQSFGFAYSMILPAFRGAKFVKASGLGNERGFLPVLPTMRHRDYPEIYGVGVSVHLGQINDTQVSIGTPKSGQMTEAMAMVAAQNIAVELGSMAKPLQVPTLEALCFAEYGDTGIAYIAAPVLPDRLTGKRRYSYAIQGIWVNWAKAAFEKYFLAKMRLGIGLPWFEKLGLRLLFGLSMSRPAMAEDIVQPVNV